MKKSLIRRIGEAALIVVMLPILLPLLAFVLLLYGTHRIALYTLIWLLWLPGGKDVLVVYSDSPIWHDYMTTQIVPLVEKRAVILNWSERNKWPKWSLPTQVFRSFGSDREFNPMVAVFRPFRRAKLFRFWAAFKDTKRGYNEPVDRLRNELLLTL
jgi:hypothetical protein